MPLPRAVLLGCLPAAAAGVLPASSAAAEDEPLWRPGAPPVLERAAPAADGEADAAAPALFGEAWRAAGSPRLAVLFGRALDDRLSDFAADARLVVGRESRSGDGETAGETTVRVETAAAPAQAPAFSEIDRLRFETGFSRPFLEAGATLVDRAAAMRLLHAERAPESVSRRVDDSRWIETEALRAYADMVVQISAVSPTGGGVAFRVAAVDLRTGETRADLFVDDAGATAAASEWRAVRGGFVRVKEEGDVDFRKAGRALALRTMEELRRAWR